MTDILAKPISLYRDNIGAIALAKNPEYHARTKHIGVRYHFQREEIEAGNVELDYISISEQAADSLTKPLPKIAFRRFLAQLGMQIDIKKAA